MIRIVNKPLNHRRWKTIYLLVILLTLMFAPIGKADITNKVTHSERVEYHWPALQNYINQMRVRQLLYGKRQKKAQKTVILEIPEPQPTPSETCLSFQRRRRGHRQLRVQFAFTQGQKASRLSCSLRRQNLRGSYRLTPQSPQGKRTLYGSVSALSLRGAT